MHFFLSSFCHSNRTSRVCERERRRVIQCAYVKIARKLTATQLLPSTRLWLCKVTLFEGMRSIFSSLIIISSISLFLSLAISLSLYVLYRLSDVVAACNYDDKSNCINKYIAKIKRSHCRVMLTTHTKKRRSFFALAFVCSIF